MPPFSLPSFLLPSLPRPHRPQHTPIHPNAATLSHPLCFLPAFQSSTVTSAPPAWPDILPCCLFQRLAKEHSDFHADHAEALSEVSRIAAEAKHLNDDLDSADERLSAFSLALLVLSPQSKGRTAGLIRRLCLCLCLCFVCARVVGCAYV